jgi:hypothetical protein
MLFAGRPLADFDPQHPLTSDRWLAWRTIAVQRFRFTAKSSHPATFIQRFRLQILIGLCHRSDY